MSRIIRVKVITELSEELKTKYSDFHGIYLFGSQARGEANNNSDYDIAIVFNNPSTWQVKNELISIIYKYMLEYDIIIEPIFMNSNDIIKPNSPLKFNILKEGIYYGV